MDALLAADVPVTDVSSRAFNFMLLDKPVVLCPRAHPPAGSLAQTTYDLLCRGAVVAEALFANPGEATDAVTQVLYSELGLLA